MNEAANIALIGFMAAGKSSVGRLLGERLGRPFIDVDDEIERAESLTVADIFARHGEGYFRDREGEVFRRVAEGMGLIIGLGGGTLLDPRNRAVLLARCATVWLKASAQEVIRRMALPDAPERPLVQGGEPGIVVPRLLGVREPLYRGADLIVDTDGKSIDAICDEIIAWIAAGRTEA